jgi:hypothetical protein
VLVQDELINQLGIKMSNLIMNIAKQYPHLDPSKITRNAAFGVVLNNTTVSGKNLAKHPSGARVTGQVLRQLGFVETKAVEGNLDDF